ncbi:MAG TPA: preprotein translocase subunit YajC [Bacillota bacterium]|nr:preprotein translocase subunit YajC [Bacillota bacterium]
MQDGSILSLIIPLVLMFAVFYFLLIRPQQKRQREVKEMQDALQKGDNIVTIGGMHGKIHAMDEDTIVITTDDGVKLTYDRTSVREVVNQES